jgi:peptidyl-prolyl cis-trans isomerase C
MKSIQFLAGVFCAATLSISSAGVCAEAKQKPAEPAAAKAQPKPDAASAFVLPETVAVVEGAEIKRGEVEKALAEALASSGKTSDDISDARRPQIYRNVVDGMVMERLVQKRAQKMEVADKEIDQSLKELKAHFPSEAEMEAALKAHGETLAAVKDSIRSSLKEQKWLDSQIAGKADVSDADAHGFYDKNTGSFKQPESVRASHILIRVEPDAKPEVVAEKKKLAASLRERAKKGEAFDKLAKEFSEDPGSKETGGDLDYFSHDQMVPELADAAFKLKQDEISDLVQSQFGFHVIKATGKKEARVVPFDEAKEKIVAYLKEQKRRDAIEQVLSEMRSKADVKVNLPAAAPDAP